MIQDEVVVRTDVDLTAIPKKRRGQLAREILVDAQNGTPALGIELVDVRIKGLNYIK